MAKRNKRRGATKPASMKPTTMRLTEAASEVVNRIARDTGLSDSRTTCFLIDVASHAMAGNLTAIKRLMEYLDAERTAFKERSAAEGRVAAASKLVREAKSRISIAGKPANTKKSEPVKQPAGPSEPKA